MRVIRPLEQRHTRKRDLICSVKTQYKIMCVKNPFIGRTIYVYMHIRRLFDKFVEFCYSKRISSDKLKHKCHSKIQFILFLMMYDYLLYVLWLSFLHKCFKSLCKVPCRISNPIISFRLYVIN